MRILGIDPGIRAAGWALVSFDGPPVLVGAGVVRPPPEMPLEKRLRVLHELVLDVIDLQKPDAAAVERVFSGVNPQSLITLGAARGVLLLALAIRSLPVGELTPAEVKRAVTGTAAAEKEQVRRMIAALLPSDRKRPLPLDAADAAAIALAWGYRVAVRGAHFSARSSSAESVSASKDPAVPISFGSAPAIWRRRPSG